MRHSWKKVADNLSVFLTREQLCEALAYYSDMVRRESIDMTNAERDATLKTVSYLTALIAEFDAAFVPIPNDDEEIGA